MTKVLGTIVDGLTRLSLLQVECESPRKGDTLGSFYTWEFEGPSPDHTKHQTLRDCLIAELHQYQPGYEIPDKANNVKLIEQLNKTHVALGVYRHPYPSMGYHLSPMPGATSPDMGLIGVIFNTHHALYKLLGHKHFSKETENATLLLFREELADYSAWWQNQCYAFKIEEANSPTSQWDQTEYEDGFFGKSSWLNGMKDAIPEDYADLREVFVKAVRSGEFDRKD